ncbi:MAG: gamma-glutamylcyclotransferase family protein [Gemmatimonadales bacterium]
MPADGANVFTYGSLMYRRVWDRVVAGEYPARPGTIRGFERRRIVGEVYPALVPGSPERSVGGVVYLGVSAADLAALDQFEGEAYRRIEVVVDTGDGSGLAAWTYAFVAVERVDQTEWDAERFAAEHLDYFLDTYCRERGR